MSEGGMARGLTEGSRAAAAAAAPPLAADTNQDDLSGNEPCEHVCSSGSWIYGDKSNHGAMRAAWLRDWVPFPCQGRQVRAANTKQEGRQATKFSGPLGVSTT